MANVSLSPIEMEGRPMLLIYITDHSIKIDAVKHNLTRQDQVVSADHLLQMVKEAQGHQHKVVQYHQDKVVLQQVLHGLKMHHLVCKIEALHLNHNHKVILVLRLKVRDLHLKVSNNLTAVVPPLTRSVAQVLLEISK